MSKPIWFTAVGDFQAIGVAHSEDPNALVPVTGTITFTPMLANGDVIRATTATPRPTGLIPLPITGILDDEGRVRLRRPVTEPAKQRQAADALKADPAAAKVEPRDGEVVGVRLMGDSPLLELKTPLFYRVSFNNIKYGGVTSGSITSFVFKAPDVDGAIVNLIEVMRVPGQTAVGALIPGPPGQEGPPGPPGQGLFNPAALVDLSDPTLDTGLVVIDRSVRAEGEVKVSSWAAFKARIATWLETLEAKWSNKTLESPAIEGKVRMLGNSAILPPRAHHQTISPADYGTPTDYVDLDVLNPWIDTDTAPPNERYLFRLSSRGNVRDYRLAFYLDAANAQFPNGYASIRMVGSPGVPRDLLLTALNGGQVMVGHGPPYGNRTMVSPVVSEDGVQNISNKTIRTSTLVDPAVDGALQFSPAAGIMPAVDPDTITNSEPAGSLNDWREVDVLNPWVDGLGYGSRYVFRFSANGLSQNFRTEFMNYATATAGNFRIQLRGDASVGPRDIRLVPLNGGKVTIGQPAVPVVTETGIQNIFNKTISASTLVDPKVDLNSVPFTLTRTATTSNPSDRSMQIDHTYSGAAGGIAMAIRGFLEQGGAAGVGSALLTLAYKDGSPGTGAHWAMRVAWENETITTINGRTGDILTAGKVRIGCGTTGGQNGGYAVAAKVPVPATSTSPGGEGYWAEDGNNFFVYSEVAGKWKKIAMEDF